MPNPNCLKAIAAFGLFSAFLVAGCSRSEAPAGPATDPIANTPSAAALAILAKADAADGTVDKVVSKCLVCVLEMEGKPEHSTAYGEYTLHLCSAYCKESFTKEPEKTLLAPTRTSRNQTSALHMKH